jgi:hypothetical protein
VRDAYVMSEYRGDREDNELAAERVVRLQGTSDCWDRVGRDD